MGSSEVVTAEFQRGLQLKDLARRSLENLPAYLQAADHFERAGKLSLEEASKPDLDHAIRLQAETYGHYYLAEQISCRGAFHHEQRQTALAAEEHRRAIEHLTQSIAAGESAIPQLPPDVAAKLKKNIDFNRFSLQLEELAVLFAHARNSLDRGDLIAALDYYKRIIQRSEKAGETAAYFDPVHERISKGNLYGAMANAHQAHAHIYMKQFGEMNDKTERGTIPQHIGDEVFKQELRIGGRPSWGWPPGKL
jgi:tetratricopeptide (TPR) repeat protein